MNLASLCVRSQYDTNGLSDDELQTLESLCKRLAFGWVNIIRREDVRNN